MVPPPPVPGCPPGMEYLCVLDQILIKQDMHALEVLTGLQVRNQFRLYNSIGQQCYFAFEESDFCQRQFCAAARWFVYHITDNMQQSGMVFRCSWYYPTFGIWDTEQNLFAEVHCPYGVCRAVCGCEEIRFSVIDKRSGTEIGSITRLRTGILQELFTKANNLSVTCECLYGRKGIVFSLLVLEI
ncbi:hypothetical protein BaRGS_00023330 [Batillaria attramentaria]|uniref:Phospholipid scramblase n=1 Tax=Batillaria attramentaria TaxID=370345 RepID=A0ABD0KEB5_9CAEN